MQAKSTRIVIAAGGTAGHVVPALAVADALRAEGAEVHFIGGDRAEAQLIPAAGYPLHRISVEGLSRTNPLVAIRALLRAAGAFLAAFKLLSRLEPQAVLGAGGYVAGPVGAAAACKRIPLVLTEADSHLGLTNRLLARRARRVCLAFPIDDRDSDRYLLSGRPIPAVEVDRADARRALGIELDERCVLVFGGSLGAYSINQASVQAFADADFHVLHICGRRDYPQLSQLQLGGRYDLREYMSVEQFTVALAAADLVIARAGGSIFEIAAHGLPAILVPYPYAAGDHQSTNAQWMARAGGAVVIEDTQLDAESLATQVLELLADQQRLRSMAEASRSLARPQAAQVIAGEVLEAAGEG